MAPSGPPPADPADARTHEPRPASERALRGLATWLDGRIETAVIAGAPGAGTTYVLHRLQEQERERRAVLFSPFLHIEADALEPWLDGLARAAGFASLDAWLAPAPRSPLLLVDEAHTAAPEALEALARLRAARLPQLRVCLGGCAGPALDRAGQLVGLSGMLVLELPPWSEEDLRRLAAALCAVAPVDAAALVASAEGSPELLRLTWSEQRDGFPLPARPVAAPAPAPAVAAAQPPAPAAVREPAPVARPAARAPESPPTPPVARPSPVPPAAVAVSNAAPAPTAVRDPDPIAPARISEPPPPAAPRVEPARTLEPPVLPTTALHEAAPPPLRRRSRMPWFHAAALVIGFGLGLAGGWSWDAREPVREPVPEPVSEAPRLPAVSTPPPSVPPVVPAAALSRHDVQVNARPWAWIQIDGEAVGVTPLVLRGLAAGAHEFEATFPDGRRERRSVEIGPDSRFVSFSD